jgi:signal transduction histidine kinase
MDVGDLRALGLFDGTDDARLRELFALGTEVPFEPGQEMFGEGRPADFWWVLLEGRVDLIRHVGREETQLGSMDVPGRWAGGFRAWDEHGAYLATARASTAGRFFRVPAGALRGWATTWFPLGVHLIEGLFRTARSFESTTRQKEALIALGTLAAGLAHQLNNPAAAATRAADGLAEASAAMLMSLRRLATSAVTAEQFTGLDTLRLELAPQPGTADPMEVADRETAVADWLAAAGVARPWGTAAALARAGADVAWCDRAAAVLGGPALEPGLDWVASTLTSASLLAQVKESTRRISDLVAAAKSYSQLDRASMQWTDVSEGLESTLMMLADRIPPEVRVVRDFGADVPRIQAAAAELNQVWTNLVDNALHALDGGGTLRVSTRADARGGVVVEIGDTGSGMSAEAQAHAFDPFFTTRGVGEGVGLGLDIARRIVEGHRGEIAIDVPEGETVLRVRLPAGGR